MSRPVFEIIEETGPKGERLYYGFCAGARTNVYDTRRGAVWASGVQFGKEAVEHPSSAARATAPVAAIKVPSAKLKAPRTITVAEALAINEAAQKQLAKATTAQTRAANRVAAVGALVLSQGLATIEQAPAADLKAQRAELDRQAGLGEPQGIQNTPRTLVLGRGKR